MPGLIYAGTDDGNLQVSRDDGETWENVVDRIPGLPERTYVSRVEPSNHAEGRVYATFDGHRNGDYAAYAYVSEDYGQSWRAIANGLPDGWSVNVIVEHQRAPNLLFIGNEVGVFVSVDRGESWVQLKNNLPTVPVDDILVHPRENDLIVGTHGRSLYILADVAPLEALSEGMLAEAGGVFGDHSIMWTEKGDWPFYGATYSAPNPPRGARIRYYLRDAPEETMAEDDEEDDGEGEHEDGDDDEDGDGDGDGDGDAFALKIADASGVHVRTLEAPAEVGINEVIWDWRHDAPYEREGGGGPGGGGGFFFGGAPRGPIVLPGTYTVSMEAGGETFSAEVEVVAEPRRPMSRADRMARQDALLSLHAMAGPIYEAGQALDALEEQLSAAEELIEGADEAPEGLEEELEAIEEEIEEIRDELADARRNAGVANAIQGSSTVPTADHLWQVDEVWNVMPELLDRLNVLIEARVPALNAQLYAEGVRPSAGEPIALPDRPGG